MDDIELIDSVYDAASDPDGWQTLAPTLAEAFSSPSTQISLVPQRGAVQRLSSTANYHPAIDAAYKSHFHKIDRFVRIGKSVPPETPIVSSDFLSDADFENSEHYRDYCRHLEIFYCFGVLLKAPGDSVMALGIHRDRRHPFEVTEADRVRLRSIGRHIVRSHGFSRMTTRQSVIDGLAGLFDRLHVPALVVDNALRIYKANAAAETTIARYKDSLRIRNRHLGIADPQFLSRLKDRLNRIAGNLDTTSVLLGLQLLEGETTKTLTFEALPLPRQWNACRAGETRILLLVHEPDGNTTIPAQKKILTDAVGDLYRLTRTESRLAWEFGSGRTIAEISASNRIATNTTRHHLKQLFAKMNCHRQSDIVRIFHRFSLGPN